MSGPFGLNGRYGAKRTRSTHVELAPWMEGFDHGPCGSPGSIGDPRWSRPEDGVTNTNGKGELNGTGLTRGEGLINGLGLTNEPVRASRDTETRILRYNGMGLTNGNSGGSGSGLHVRTALINGLAIQKRTPVKPSRRVQGRKARRRRAMIEHMRKKSEVPVGDIGCPIHGPSSMSMVPSEE